MGDASVTESRQISFIGAKFSNRIQGSIQINDQVAEKKSASGMVITSSGDGLREAYVKIRAERF